MSKYSAKRNSLVRRERNALVPADRDVDAVDVTSPVPGNWLSFRYSFTEISASGGTARVKSKRARYEDGKLSTEAFEGVVDRSAYDRMLDDAQLLVASQMTLFRQMLASFLPEPPKRKRDRQ